MEKLKSVGIIALIILTISSTLYFSRQIFSFQYDPEYYENYYYHSQWNIPNSTRGISDSDLYKFVGYRLVEGENPFNVNYEVPPLGKYLYGLSEKVLKNPFWLSAILYLCSIFILTKFSKDLFKNKIIVYLSILLFCISPFVATQVKETMLDLPMMFFYLIHTWLFCRFISDKKKISNLILSGIFLGLATGTKIGIYTPFAVLLGIVFIFIISRQKIKSTILYIGSIFSGYVLAFFCYFMKHPNPIPWIKLHQKPLSFYLHNGITNIDHFNQWRGIFLNSYKGFWVSAVRTNLGDWSVVLPIGVIALIIAFCFGIRKHDFRWIYLACLASVFLVINSFIPFYPRYLMPIIPILILVIAYVFKKYPQVLFILFLISIPSYKSSIINYDLNGDIGALSRFISTSAYRELYRSINPTTLNGIDESKFIEENERIYRSLGIRRIDVKFDNVSHNTKQGKANLVITYATNYGNLINNSTIKYNRIHNQWKLDWDWGYLLNHFNPDMEFVYENGSINVEKIVDSQNNAIAVKGDGYEIYMVPRLMKDWSQSLNSLRHLTGYEVMDLDNIIKRSVPDQFPRFVGYLKPNIDPSEANKTVGVQLIQTEYLTVSPDIKEKDKSAMIIQEVSKKYPELFEIKSKISLRDKNNNTYQIPLIQTNLTNQLITVEDKVI